MKDLEALETLTHIKTSQKVHPDIFLKNLKNVSSAKICHIVKNFNYSIFKCQMSFLIRSIQYLLIYLTNLQNWSWKNLKAIIFQANNCEPHTKFSIFNELIGILFKIFKPKKKKTIHVQQYLAIKENIECLIFKAIKILITQKSATFNIFTNLFFHQEKINF